MEREIQKYIAELQDTLDHLPLASISNVVEVLHQARLNRQRVFVMGNGGSASTASHIVCDLAKNTRRDDLPHFQIMEIADNSAIFSAYANDEGYENVFASHLANFVELGDVVLGISSSGNSANVLRAIDLANRSGAITIGFTGFDGGVLRSLVALNVHVISDCIEQVEDIHLVLGHIITMRLRAMVTDDRLQLSENGSKQIQS